MGTVLKNIIQFTGLVVGVPTPLPHGLNVNGIPVAPKIGGANAAGFTFTATATNVIATRTADAASGDVDCYVEYWHTIEAVVPLPGELTGLTPFFFATGGGGSGIVVDTYTAVDPTLISLDPDIDGAILTNDVPTEGTANFTLGDPGAEPAFYDITVNVNGAGGGTLQLDIPNLNTATPGVTTFQLAASTYGGLRLMRNAGVWFVVSQTGFTGPI